MTRTKRTPMLRVEPRTVPAIRDACVDYLTNVIPGSTVNEYRTHLGILRDARMLFIDSNLFEGFDRNGLHDAFTIPEFIGPDEDWFVVFSAPLPGLFLRGVFTGYEAFPEQAPDRWPVRGLFMRTMIDPDGDGTAIVFRDVTLLADVGSMNRDATLRLSRMPGDPDEIAVYRRDSRNRSPLLPVTETFSSFMTTEPWIDGELPWLPLYPANEWGNHILFTVACHVAAAVKRAGREGVTVIGRHRDGQGTPAPRPRVPPEVNVISIHPHKWIPEDGRETVRHVEWTHRWKVRGYWRNQAYGPGRKLHRRIFVQGHVKGPKDKPLWDIPTVYTA